MGRRVLIAGVGMVPSVKPGAARTNAEAGGFS